ncbi:amino acid/amide ABC transporter substrate-binding protein, HAAT family [Frankia sp. EI5c]|nr:amino acid/amide ABC transporter substrate-binding protein, HAAT family [Frankia sp. EI5c]
MSGLRQRRRGRWLLAGAVALSITVTSAACGGSDDSPTPASTAAAAAALGAKKPAAGTPITLGYISASASDNALSAQFQRVEAGLQAARGYLNDYQGGIAGHPVELFICQGGETPAGSQDCANQMVNKNVAAVITSFTGQGSVVTPILTKAGIPYVGMTGASTEELTAPGVFILTGGFPSTLAGYAQHAKDHGVRKFALLATDVPAALQAAQGIGGIVFKNAGVGYEVVPVPLGTPDMTSQLQAAVSGGADAIGIVGDLTFCASWMQAYQTLGLTQARYLLTTCIDPSNVKAYASVIDGAVLASTLTTDLESADARLYAAIAQTYGKDVDPDPNVSSGQSGGVTTLLSVARALDGLTGDPTPAAILAAFKAAKDVPLFLSGGATFTCDGKQVSILPNICSSDVQVGLLDDEGRLQKPTLVHTSDLFTL